VLARIRAEGWLLPTPILAALDGRSIGRDARSPRASGRRFLEPGLGAVFGSAFASAAAPALIRGGIQGIMYLYDREIRKRRDGPFPSSSARYVPRRCSRRGGWYSVSTQPNLRYRHLGIPFPAHSSLTRTAPCYPGLGNASSSSTCRSDTSRPSRAIRLIVRRDIRLRATRLLFRKPSPSGDYRVGRYLSITDTVEGPGGRGYGASRGKTVAVREKDSRSYGRQGLHARLSRLTR
jgi:hypothetical protein